MMMLWVMAGGAAAVLFAAALRRSTNTGFFQRFRHKLRTSIGASLSTRGKHSLLPLLGLLFVVVGAAALTFPPAAVNTVTLPIEVIPPDGRSVHATSVTVGVSDPSGVDSLYIQGHALGYHKSPYAESNGYDQKASFRINGGSWIPIDNATATCKYPEKLYATEASNTTPGCIGGPFHTLRLELPISGTGALQSGKNEIEFRFNGTDGIGSGYRILDMELRRAGDSDAIDGTSFEKTDYSTWAPPSGYDNSTAISDGGDLWSKRGALVDGGLAQGLDNQVPIEASCADCHARDGRDLKYFNFSNRSIVSRSRFHGLTKEQGKKIAAYIRTRDLELPSGYDADDTGRPWNPPYQPGPGIDDKPVELWAAGAGIEWVLDSEREEPGTERDMLTHIFPNGITGQDGLAAVHPDSTINNREIPIAIQLPDWNNWLPDVHPFDIYEGGASTFMSSEPWDNYMALHENLDTPSEVQAEIDESRRRIDELATLGILTLFRKHDNDRKQFDGLSRKARWGGSPDPKVDNIAIHQWLSVKQWEVNQMYHLEDLGDEVYEGHGLRLGGLDRTWLGKANNVYDLAPHKNSKPEYPNSFGPYSDTRANAYFSTAWYELQLILNPDNRHGSGWHPFDWNYHHPHIAGVAEGYGHNQYLRFLKGQITVQQQQANYNRLGENPDASFTDYSNGWKIRDTMPWRTYWESEFTWNREHFPSQNLIPDIAETMLRGWFTETARYAPSEWPRSDNAQEGVEFESYEPTLQTQRGITHTPDIDNLYTLLARYENIGVSPALLDRVASWGEKMWPKGNWEQWILDGAAQSVQIESGWNMISTRVMPDSPTMRSVFSDVSVSVVKDEDGNVYMPEHNLNEIGKWDSTEAYKVYTETDQAMTVQGSRVEETTSIPLQKGWNQVPYLPETAKSVDDALASIIGDVVIVKDESGNTYVPSYNVDDIGTLKPGKGYQVYVDRAVDLVYSEGTSSTTAAAAANSRNSSDDPNGD